MLDLGLAIVHHITVFGLVALLAMEWVMLRDATVDPARLTKVDAGYGLVAGLAVVARLALEDLSIHLYPARCAALTLPDLPPPSPRLRLMAIVARTAITLLVLSAFLGLSWPAIAIAVLLSIPLVLRVWVDRIPNSLAVHRWTPRGVLKLTISTIIGLLLVGWIFASEGRSALLPGILALLLLPSAVWSIVDVFGRAGGNWHNVWPKRVLGIAVWCICAGLLTGVIVLGI